MENGKTKTSAHSVFLPPPPPFPLFSPSLFLYLHPSLFLLSSFCSISLSLSLSLGVYLFLPIMLWNYNKLESQLLRFTSLHMQIIKTVIWTKWLRFQINTKVKTCHTTKNTHPYYFRAGIMWWSAWSLQHRTSWLKTCHSEIGNFYVILFVQQQIFWLQIPMTAEQISRFIFLIITVTSNENLTIWNVNDKNPRQR